MKPDLDVRQDEQVGRVEIGVEETVLVEHADDRLGAEIDQPLSLFGREQPHPLVVRSHPVEELHAQALGRPRTAR